MGAVVYGLGYKALKAISELDQTLIEAIDLLIIAKDKSIVNDYSEAIEKIAIERKINYKFRSGDDSILSASYHIAIGWRWLINVGENEKLIVIHDSLLPKYRGFNPLVTALLNGDEKVGVTALFGTESYDKGDVIYQSSITVKYPIKINEAITLISDLYAELLIKILAKISGNVDLEAIPQNEEDATYSLWRDEEDYAIDWNNDAAYIKRLVDSVGYPYNGASCFYENEKIRIEEVTLIDDVSIENRQAGKLIFKDNRKPVIVCGKGLLRIDVAKHENGNEVVFNSFRIRLK
ncbi:formyltransferase family protein [Flavobacterium sp. GCM10023249]|uniref:formyltransferase family protein n=1 Tax=unclassified Flavobacterium TaxID=196869 RepID=UPI003621AFB9